MLVDEPFGSRTTSCYHSIVLARLVLLLAAGGAVLPLAADSCTFGLQVFPLEVRTTSTVAFTGQPVSIQVLTQPECLWTPTVDVGWLTRADLFGYTLRGPGQVTYQVGSNLGGPRSALISIGNGRPSLSVVSTGRAFLSSCSHDGRPASTAKALADRSNVSTLDIVAYDAGSVPSF